jgi:hypothetical protein
MSMARFWRAHGKRNEARELLAPVCGWFTEGSDTLDLKDYLMSYRRESGSDERNVRWFLNISEIIEAHPAASEQPTRFGDTRDKSTLRPP